MVEVDQHHLINPANCGFCMSRREFERFLDVQVGPVSESSYEACELEQDQSRQAKSDWRGKPVTYGRIEPTRRLGENVASMAWGAEEVQTNEFSAIR